jgi:hypothetical protein
MAYLTASERASSPASPSAETLRLRYRKQRDMLLLYYTLYIPLLMRYRKHPFPSSPPCKIQSVCT